MLRDGKTIGAKSLGMNQSAFLRAAADHALDSMIDYEANKVKRDCIEAQRKLHEFDRRGFDNWNHKWSLQMEFDRCCNQKNDPQ